MATSNLNTAPSTTTNCTLELDFPWLVPSSTPPSLDLSADLPVASGPISPVPTQQALHWDLPTFWSPICANEKAIPHQTSTPASTSPLCLTSSPAGNSSDSSGYSSLLSSTPSSSGSNSYVSATASPVQNNAASVAAAAPSAPRNDAKVTTGTALKKPTASYIEMIARALLSTVHTKMILGEIYAYILEKYPYFQTAPDGNWRNAVRHNLCVNDCFIKSGRSNSGRGYFWTIHPACLDMFSRGDFSRMKARRLAQKMYKTLNNAAASSGRAKVAPVQIASAAPTSYPTSTATYPSMTSGVPASSSYMQPGPYYMRSVPVTSSTITSMSMYPATVTTPTVINQDYSRYYNPSSYYTSGSQVSAPYTTSHGYQHIGSTLQSLVQPQLSTYRPTYQSQYYNPHTASPSVTSYQGYGMPTYL